VPNLEEGSFPMFLQLMAHSRSDAGEELIHAKWFGNVIVGTKIEGCNLTGLVASAGKDNDGQGLLAMSDPPQEIVPVDVGKAQIENHKRRLLCQQFQRALSIRGF